MVTVEGRRKAGEQHGDGSGRRKAAKQLGDGEVTKNGNKIT